jgi:phospholipid transport system transporter-binding protein
MTSPLNMQAVLNIQGALTLGTAKEVLKQGQAWIKQLPADGQMDFSAVTQSDSAGIALLIAWARFAKQQHCVIQFVHLPTQLMTIAKLSSLDTILPIIPNNNIGIICNQKK